MSLTLEEAVARFGAAVQAKLGNRAAEGEPEEQLRSPLETLVLDLAEVSGLPRSVVACVGETALADLKTRPDFAVSKRDALVGFLEVKAPGKGADPRRYRGHDQEQWEKLQALPNLLYTDGQEFSLWQDGELVEHVRLEGDLSTAGRRLAAPPALLKLFSFFFLWEPVPPRTPSQLAGQTARLCRFLRDEAAEQLVAASPALTNLAAGWRRMLFPEASDAQFADGYAQAVTFGLLVARARGIRLADGLEGVARQLGTTDSLIGAALRIVTQEVERETTLKTSLATLVRVLDVVSWEVISRGEPEAWLYFYEEFLDVYDHELRKKTGSYYTPPEVVEAMVGLVDEALRDAERFALPRGLAAESVTVADPAVGTGTFILGVLRCIAQAVDGAEGPGAIPGAVRSALRRLIAFEMQLGPFAVAQLRVMAEAAALLGETPATPPRMYVTDTLGNPNVEEEWLPNVFLPIAESRREANRIKRQEPITVVLGNPPYKEKAKGLGGWVEGERTADQKTSLLSQWAPPREWGVGAHAKHLRNLYVYFWRWATYKVFDHNPRANTGIVCFITVAGFLNGPGFQKMREYLRRRANDVWVIDCSPEGHQPDVPTRIFQGVQQPVCIVLASRHRPDDGSPATVRFRALPAGRREDKFRALAKVRLRGRGWTECPREWRAPFLPEAKGAWADYPALEQFFEYHGSGVMPGRTWVIAPDADTLRRRWQALQKAPAEKKELLFYPHLVRGELSDRHVMRAVKGGLPGHESRKLAVGLDKDSCVAPVRYAFRSFNRQWIIPDYRLINRPNPQLWAWHSRSQVYLTAFTRCSPTSGPALTFCSLLPDLHHYKGNFGGRVFPLWRDAAGHDTNVRLSALFLLGLRCRSIVSPEDLFAYLAAVAAHPAYTARFQRDLVQPGLRIPLTSDAALFREAVDLGRRVLWLHTFGERFADAKAGRPAGPPRLPRAQAPRIPAAGALPDDPARMPETIDYDASRQRLLVGEGYVERVPSAVWEYEVSGKPVVRQWFSYRAKVRERPVMGDRRPPSPLEDIQSEQWLAEYTTDLLDLLHVLGLLIELEPQQAKLLDRVCAGPLVSADELASAPPPPPAAYPPRDRSRPLLDALD